MTATLLSFCDSIPELTGRVFPDTAPKTQDTPYAIVWESPGGVTAAYYGQTDVLTVYPSVTVYHKPGPKQNAAQARAALLALMAKISAAVHAVDTHSDGVTPLVRGSFSRASEFPPLPDKNVTDGYYATARFSAMYVRS